MIVNRKHLRIEVRLSSLEVPISNGLDKAIIAGSSFRGALRHYLADRKWPELVEQLFGTDAYQGQMQLSDLRAAPDIGKPEFRTEFRVGIDRQTSLADPSSLSGRGVVRDATFQGEVWLKNGGYHPSIIAHRAIGEVFEKQRYFGAGVNRGHGRVESIRLERNFDRESDGLNPVEEALRQANLRLAAELAEWPTLVHSLEWRDLERVIALCYEELGFNVELTKSSGDGGKDVVLQFNLSSTYKLNADFYVEIKHWSEDRPVGLGPIRKLYEIKLRNKADGAILLSTSGFSDSARKAYDEHSGITLGDLSVIRSLCRFFVASRENGDLRHRTLEEIVSPSAAARLGKDSLN